MNALIFKWTILSLCILICINKGYSQVVTTVAGITEVAGEQDGKAIGEATFNNPHGIATDSRGLIFVADRWNHRIRVLDLNREIVYTLAGNGDVGFEDGNGQDAKFYSPWGIAADSVGNIYVADTKNQRIRKIDTMGNVTTLAGSGASGVSDGAGAVATFFDPTGIACTPDGNVYVCDHLGHTIRHINPSGVVRTIAGTPKVDGYRDGPGGSALFNRPYGMEIDHLGNLFVADEFNHVIRKIDPSGMVTTFAGDGNLGSIDGTTLTARFNYPYDVVVGLDNVAYVMDGANRVIRKVDTTGQVTTFAGEAGVGGGVDGVGVQAKFGAATAITMDFRTCDLYVGDTYNHLIRKVAKQATVRIDGSPLRRNDTVCLGHQAMFTAQPQVYEAYNFYIRGQLEQSSTSPEFSTILIDTGIINITVVGIDQAGEEVTSQLFPLFIAQYPTADFTFSAIGETIDGYEVEFSQNSPFAQRFYWDFGDSLAGPLNFSTDPNPTHLYTEYGEYSVKLITSVGTNCMDSVVFEKAILYTENPSNIFIPNAFTPNDDGLNDVLYIRGSQISEVDFMIFNEWGELIFQTNDPAQGWDGTRGGAPVQPDTYIYAARITLFNGKEIEVSGQTTVLK